MIEASKPHDGRHGGYNTEETQLQAKKKKIECAMSGVSHELGGITHAKTIIREVERAQR